MIPFRHVLAALALVLSASAGAADIPDIPDAPDPSPAPSPSASTGSPGTPGAATKPSPQVCTCAPVRARPWGPTATPTTTWPPTWALLRTCACPLGHRLPDPGRDCRLP